MAVQSFADLSAPAKAALGIFGISAVVLVFLAFRLFASLVTRLANALPTSGTKRSASKAKQEASQEDEKPRAGAGQPGVSLKQLQRRAKEAETAGRKSSAQHDERVTHHPLFVVRLYNLGGDVTNRGITFRRVRCLRRPQAVAVGDTPNDMLLVLKGDVERPALCRMRHSKAGWEVLSEVSPKLRLCSIDAAAGALLRGCQLFVHGT